VGNYERIEGLSEIVGIEMIDQSPIGRSSRSTPATYTKVFDHIRDVFASTQAAKQMGWKPGHFSFNVAGGRCDTCEGEGRVTIEMQFLPDIELPCEVCGGSRYKKEVLGVLFEGRSIVDVLNMTVTEAMEHFSDVPKVRQRLENLRKVGLGYIRLGQPSTHLSGGEAQRVKLASNIDVNRDGHTLFVFDEPTTGLHVHDVSYLLAAFDTLVDAGNSVLIIEHNLHVIASADYVIDLGPEGGSGGGYIIATGTPRQVSKVANSYTGHALKAYFAELGVQRESVV
jgi:excinuclease ABC subunit A